MTRQHASTLCRTAIVCVLAGLLVAAVAYWRGEVAENSAALAESPGPSPTRMATSSAADKSPTPAASARAARTLIPAHDRSSSVPSTQPVPSEAAQREAAKLIREVFRQEYSQTDPAERRALAVELLEEGIKTRSNLSARYVLFCEARDMAAAAGDASTAVRAIEMLRRDFGSDDTRMIIEALATAAGTARTPEAFTEIVQVAFLAADAAMAKDDYIAAEGLVTIAARAAAKARRVELVQQVRDRSRIVRDMAGEYARVKMAREVLQTRGNDPESSLVVGRYLCFVKGDFGSGLAFLASGSDPTLRAAAIAELAGYRNATEALKIANMWWGVAQAQSGLARKNLQRHAGQLYRTALNGLAGFDRSLAEKRLDLLEAETIAELGLRPGLYAELFRGIDFVQRVATRIDPRIDFDWGEAAPDESLPKDNFSLRWRGMLKVSAAGRYEIVAIANTGTRVWIDGQRVFDEPNLTRKRNGIRRPIDLSSGVHAVRVEYWDTSGIAKMKLLWRAPGAGRDEPIPATCLFHEPRLVADK